MAPGLRLGYVAAPERLRAGLRAAVNMSCWMPPPLMAEIASRWIEDGTADRLNGWQRTEARARQALASDILGTHRFAAAPDAFSIWLPLPQPKRADAFRAEAARRGVKLLTGETFAVDHTDIPHGLRLCLSYEVTRERVTWGLRTIAALLDDPDEPDTMVV
jgi:DNA-binding transcriptional MocR family regulator